MQLVERNLEPPHDMGHDREHEARDVRCEQRVECPPDAIVIEAARVVSSQADVCRCVSCRPLTEPVDRLTGQEDVSHQQENRLRRPDTDAAIFFGQGDLEQRLEPRSAQQVVDDRQWAGRR